MEATLPNSQTDFVRVLADGRDAAVAQAGFLVVTGRRSHIAKFTQLWKLDDTVVLRNYHAIINWGGKRDTLSEYLTTSQLPGNP